MIVVFDIFVPHLIIIIYLMMVASNYGVFFLLDFLINNEQFGGHLSQKFKPVKTVMTTLFALFFVIGFLPVVGASCRAGFVYRNI